MLDRLVAIDPRREITGGDRADIATLLGSKRDPARVARIDHGAAPPAADGAPGHVRQHLANGVGQEGIRRGAVARQGSQDVQADQP